MSFEAAAWAIRQKPKLPTEKLILIALSDCHNKDTGRCDPSLLTLADVAMCSDRTAMRAIESLENQQLITTQKELGKRTKYTLNLTKTPDTRVTPDKLSPVSPCRETPVTRVTTPLTPVSPEPVRTSKEPVNKYSEKDYSLAEWIYELILITAPKTKKPNLEKWAVTVRLMVESDSNSHREIAEVFKWANSDHFWKTNILSPEKLRKQFATLHAQVINNAENQSGRSPAGHKLSAVERVRATNEANRAARADSRGDMASADGHLRQFSGESVRPDDAGSLDNVIEGDYTEAD